MDGIKNSKVENGTAAIWLLYNMGYVVKTPSGCFAIDISHRWAKELAPYIDFLCVTHKHSDHYSNDLIQAMFDLGKPVLSNYLKDTTYPYTAKGDKDYEIGKFKIKTCITDHNNAGLSNFVTVFSIDCGEDTGNFVFMHVGDSNYKPEQYTNLASHVNVLIPRYAPNALTENNILGSGAPPRLQLIRDEILQSGTTSGWEAMDYMKWYDAYDSFLKHNGFAKAFPTVDDLTRAMGNVEADTQARWQL